MPSLDELATDPLEKGTFSTPKGLDELAGLATPRSAPPLAALTGLDALAASGISSPGGAQPRTGGVGVEDVVPPSVVPGLAGVKTVVKKVWRAPGDITEGLWNLGKRVASDPHPESLVEALVGRYSEGGLEQAGKDVIGPRITEAVKTRSLDPLFEGADPLSGLIETAWEGAMARLNLGVIQKPLAMAGAIGATKLGERFPSLAKAVEPGLGWTLPRRGWTDPLTAAGATKQFTKAQR